jgi:flavodoxin
MFIIGDYSMKPIVIYDSFFGNTQKIAEVIRDSLPSETAIFKIDQISSNNLVGFDLLIVGSPTRGFRPTPAISSFFTRLPDNFLKGYKVASFDTRISPKDVNNLILTIFVFFFGYAAKPILNMLTKKGGISLALPEGFYVNGSEGPLKDGEIERAKSWAKQLLLE